MNKEFCGYCNKKFEPMNAFFYLGVSEPRTELFYKLCSKECLKSFIDELKVVE